MKTLVKHLALTVLLTGTSAKAVAPAAKKVITFGATVGDFAELIKESLKPALEKRGYQVKLVEFTDYVQPNIALADGALDVNIFQHKPYLEQFAKEKRLSLEPLAQVPTAPLGLYAGKTKTLAAVKNGASVAVPNDPTNLARALLILADLGWVTLPKSIDPFAVSPLDIVTNPKQIKIVQLEAAQIPRALADVDYAVINGNYVISSGLDLTSAIAREKSDAYVNWAVVRKSDLKAPFAEDIKAVLNSNEFKIYANKKFKGYKYPSSW